MLISVLGILNGPVQGDGLAFLDYVYIFEDAWTSLAASGWLRTGCLHVAIRGRLDAIYHILKIDSFFP